MKSLNKILCGCALLTMAASSGIGLGESEVATVKADEFATTETTASVVTINAGYNGHEAPNEAYIVLALTEHDYPSSYPTIAYAGQFGFVASDYNFMSKISFSNDRTNWTYLSDVYKDGGAFFMSDGAAIGGQLRFALRPFDGSDYKSSITRFVKIEEGCEFPSYSYVGEGQTGPALKYVQSETLVYDSLASGDDGSTRAFRDNYCVSELTTVREVVTDPATSRLWIRTTNQDYEQGGESPYQNQGAAGASSYNTFSNILLDNTKLGDLCDGNMIFDRWQRPSLSFDFASDKTELLSSATSITIPALTQLPSWTRNNDSAAVKKVYCTESDLLLNFKVLGGGHNETSPDAAAQAWYHAIETDVTGAYFANQNEANPFIGISLAETDYGDVETYNINHNDDYTLKTLRSSYVGANILMDGNALDISGFGESFLNLFGNKNSFALRLNGSSGQLNSNTITVKKGAWFPAKSYIDSNMMAAPVCYVAKETVSFTKNNYIIDDKFTKQLVDNEFATTEDLTIGNTMFRTDGQNYYFYFVPNEPANGYANLTANKTSPVDKYLGNINFFNKLHFQFYDGQIIDGTTEGLFDEFSLHKWGEKGIFLRLNKNIIPNERVPYIETVRFDAGFEVPSYDRAIKYQLKNQVTAAFADGDRYDGHFAPWHLDGNNNRGYGQRASLVWKGTTTLTPHFDADNTILYFDAPLYEGKYSPGANLAIYYRAFFNLNFLGKIKLIKGGVEKSLFEFPLADDIFVNLFDRNYSNLAIRNLDDVHSYDAIKIEAGCEIPALAENTFEGTIEYYTIAETTTWYLNNQNSYGKKATISFGDTDIEAITGGTVENVPTPTAKDADEEFSYTGYWKDGNNNRFDPNHLVEGDESYEVAYDSTRVEYAVKYQDETGAEISELEASVANASEYEVAAVPAKTGYTGAWEVVAGGVEIVDGKFTMPTANVTLKAVYTANSYTLTCGEESLTVTYGQAIGQLPEASKEHFHDCYWEIDGDMITAATVWNYASDKTATVNGTPDTFEVTFDTDGGSTVASQTLGYGASIEVTAPTKEGYTFAGWTVNNEPVDLASYVVEGDVTLKATWTINSYTVTFKDGEVETTATVNHGSKVTKPADPTKVGSTFGGWYNGDTAFDFDTPITGDVTLTAKWTVNKFTVTFDTNGGSDVAAVEVEYNNKVTKPADPTLEGYTFAGWTLNGEAFDFDTKITADVTLVATWDEIPAPAPAKGGCGGSAVAASAMITLVSALGVALVAGKKKED